jgi:hypothetical protein
LLSVETPRVALSSRDIGGNFAAISVDINTGFIGDHEAQARDGLHRVRTPNKAWSVPLWRVTHIDLHWAEKMQAML